MHSAYDNEVEKECLPKSKLFDIVKQAEASLLTAVGFPNDASRVNYIAEDNRRRNIAK